MAAYRSLLFVPGDRLERFDKAVASGADAVVIDLEDSVLPDDKARARRGVADWLLAYTGDTPVAIRINSLRTAAGCADVADLAASPALKKTPLLMVPKVETAADVAIVADAMGHKRLIAVIETPAGLSAADEIARVCSDGLLFGGADYSAALNADISDWDAMLTARAVIANAAAASGVAAYDVPDLDVGNQDRLRERTQRVKRMGFTGRACIHPSQINVVNTVFTPSAEAIADAEAVIAAIGSAGGGAVLHKGKLVDRPVVRAARQILAQSTGGRG